MTLSRMYKLSGTLVVAAVSSLLWLGGHKKTPEERETLRRRRLEVQGRFTDGTLLDVQEFDSGKGRMVQMVLYTYDVGGLQYECWQDITDLRPLLNLQSCRIGVATSVKYDSHNPGNSIVVAETWCGLRI